MRSVQGRKGSSAAVLRKLALMEKRKLMVSVGSFQQIFSMSWSNFESVGQSCFNNVYPPICWPYWATKFDGIINNMVAILYHILPVKILWNRKVGLKHNSFLFEPRESSWETVHSNILTFCNRTNWGGSYWISAFWVI